MKCIECGKEAHGFSVFGSTCSPECGQAFNERRRARHEALGHQPLLDAPPELTVADFEEFALKIAVYAVNVGAVNDVPEGLRHPDILTLQVKELLVRHIPEEYVRTWTEGSGWSRRERYSFQKPVPLELVHAAMRKAGFVWRVNWFGNVDG
jgi:hypothetical protein